MMELPTDRSPTMAEVQAFMLGMRWDEYDCFVIVKTTELTVLDAHLHEFKDAISEVVQQYFPGWRTQFTSASSLDDDHPSGEH